MELTTALRRQRPAPGAARPRPALLAGAAASKADAPPAAVFAPTGDAGRPWLKPVLPPPVPKTPNPTPEQSPAVAPRAASPFDASGWQPGAGPRFGRAASTDRAGSLAETEFASASSNALPDDIESDAGGEEAGRVPEADAMPVAVDASSRDPWAAQPYPATLSSGAGPLRGQQAGAGGPAIERGSAAAASSPSPFAAAASAALSPAEAGQCAGGAGGTGLATEHEPARGAEPGKGTGPGERARAGPPAARAADPRGEAAATAPLAQGWRLWRVRPRPVQLRSDPDPTPGAGQGGAAEGGGVASQLWRALGFGQGSSPRPKPGSKEAGGGTAADGEAAAAAPSGGDAGRRDPAAAAPGAGPAAPAVGAEEAHESCVERSAGLGQPGQGAAGCGSCEPCLDAAGVGGAAAPDVPAQAPVPAQAHDVSDAAAWLGRLPSAAAEVRGFGKQEWGALAML